MMWLPNADENMMLLSRFDTLYRSVTNGQYCYTNIVRRDKNVLPRCQRWFEANGILTCDKHQSTWRVEASGHEWTFTWTQTVKICKKKIVTATALNNRITNKESYVWKIHFRWTDVRSSTTGWCKNVRPLSVIANILRKPLLICLILDIDQK